MKDYRNDKLIKRNSRIGQITTISGILILVGGMIITFRNPNFAGLAWIALAVGFGLSQIGLYFGNRWGRHPRPDELLEKGLKGLNEQFSLYHYLTPANHLLVGPSGVWVLVPYHQIGKIVYEKGRWKQKGGGVMQHYLRAFAQEGLGRPDLEVPAEIQAVSRYLKKYLPDKEIPEPRGAMVFTSDKVDLEVDGAPIPSVPLKKLKDTIRKSAKEHPLSPDMMNEINGLFSP